MLEFVIRCLVFRGNNHPVDLTEAIHEAIQTIINLLSNTTEADGIQLHAGVEVSSGDNFSPM